MDGDWMRKCKNNKEYPEINHTPIFMDSTVAVVVEV
jgi:hypothetical protein